MKTSMKNFMVKELDSSAKNSQAEKKNLHCLQDLVAESFRRKLQLSLEPDKRV
jgi:hypothetical protein